MESAPLARTMVRGFHGTPVTSGDEDSDYGFGNSNNNSNSSSQAGTPHRGRKRRMPALLGDVVSANCSPLLRSSGSPAMSGIAKLRLQLEPLSLDSSSVSPSPTARRPVGTAAATAATPATAAATMVPCMGNSATLQLQRVASPLSRNSSKTRRNGSVRPTSKTTKCHVNTDDTAFATTVPHKATSSDASCAPTVDCHSSRSTSQDTISSRTSNTSSDETGIKIGTETGGNRRSIGQAATTSYVIRLEHDFVSESMREDVRAPGQEDGVTDNYDGSIVMFNVDTDSVASKGADTAPDTGLTGKDDAAECTPKKMTADDFEPLRCLGKGSYGTVLLVKQRSTGRLYAQKQFKKASLVVHKKLVEQTKTERQILEQVNRHPFVVKLFYAFQDCEKLYLILEYGQGGELFTHLSAERMFSEPTAAFYMAEMVLALSHLHDTLGVVYRDLKPENCLLDAEGHLLLTDFGLSKVALPGARGGGRVSSSSVADEAACCHSILGTVEYMAPEVVQGHKYGRAVDWWSFGALLYDLLTGNPPFRGRNNAKIQENIVKQKLALPYFLSPDAKDLLTRLLRKDPRKRLGANMPKDLAIIKGHRFFRRVDWTTLAARALEPPIQPVITDPALAENFAAEFTDLPLSPVAAPASILKHNTTAALGRGQSIVDAAGARVGAGRGHGGSSFKEDPFGGFSFVASTSLLNESVFNGMAV